LAAVAFDPELALAAARQQVQVEAQRRRRLRHWACEPGMQGLYRRCDAQAYITWEHMPDWQQQPHCPIDSNSCWSAQPLCSNSYTGKIAAQGQQHNEALNRRRQPTPSPCSLCPAVLTLLNTDYRTTGWPGTCDRVPHAHHTCPIHAAMLHPTAAAHHPVQPHPIPPVTGA
jgi:hypothetical protein